MSQCQCSSNVSGVHCYECEDKQFECQNKIAKKKMCKKKTSMKRSGKTNELTRMEKILWDNDLEKMFTNHLEDAESALEWFKSCPKFYDQSEETWIPQIKRCEGRIDTLKQAIKLIKANKGVK